MCREIWDKREDADEVDCADKDRGGDKDVEGEEDKWRWSGGVNFILVERV